MIKIVKYSLGCLFGLLSLMLVLVVVAIWLGLGYLPVLIEMLWREIPGSGLK